MFKTYCGDCGNSWYIGNPRTCTCPWKNALKPELVGLTDEEVTQIIEMGLGIRDSIETALDKLKGKNVL